jgi:general stress protein YciG
MLAAIMKLSAKLKRQLMRELAREGGRARAAKYDTKTLSKWGAKGGRPRKKKKGGKR